MHAFRILLAAVAYDPKVVSIWQGMRDYLKTQAVSLEFALFSTYEEQLRAFLAGHVDVAYNSPLAHVRLPKGHAQPIAMRDVDRECHSKVLVRRGIGIESLLDLQGRTFAVGSLDSTYTRILPLYFLERAGVDTGKLALKSFGDEDGQHGESPLSELAILGALHEGLVDAGVVSKAVFQAEERLGRIDPHKACVLWTTPSFYGPVLDVANHVETDRVEGFRRAIAAMSYKNPKHKRILDLLGLRQWVSAGDEGYARLAEAVSLELKP